WSTAARSSASSPPTTSCASTRSSPAPRTARGRNGGSHGRRLGRVRDMTLRREDIVDAALQVADERGLDALSARRLATQLGVTPMALYRHVRNKDEILD